MCDRDEFESAVKGLCLNNPLGWSEGEYESNSTQALWDIWQAARTQVGEAVEFGQGSWTVEVGEYGKQPAVFVAPAIPPGVSGELSEPTTGADKRRLVPGEWVMTFPTKGQAFEVADALTRRRIKRLNGTWPDDAHSAPRHRDGWRLVPETPTGPMLDAWFSADRSGDPEDTNWYPAYKAMIEASPNPPEQESE